MFKKIGKTILILLAILGILFIVIMLIPTGDEKTDTVQTGNDLTEQPQESSYTNPYADIDVVSVDTDAKSATIMIYMNGSDLESEAGEACEDLEEMLASGIGKNVNVIIQTMGTKKWHGFGISSQTAQTYKVDNGKLVLVRDNLGQLDCTAKDTLSEFVGFCKTKYPADRYLFVFWNHGGGPVYGFGYDEWQDEEESLTIDEMAMAFSENSDIQFDMIGMDCCIMASMETCYALSPYCKYALLSEDFESGLGWNYSRWMKSFEENPGMATPLLGKYIIDDIITDNENEDGGDSACLALFNVSVATDLFNAWKNYAYKNEYKLLDKNYSRSHKAKGRAIEDWDLWESDGSDVTLSDYYISDILALMESVDNNSDEAKKLMSVLKASVAYYGHTSDKNELTGLSVSLPYGDSDFYDKLKDVFKGISLDNEYIEWLGSFVSSDGYDDYYDYGGFEDDWSGWGSYESDYGFNYSSGGSGQYFFDGDDYENDWVYDHEEKIWYMYEGDVLYLYDDETNTLFYYDDYEDKYYYYDEDQDDWFEVEE
ncbi:clostripain-related cysteine peptidase [Butyrivibrio sp. AE2015]|uniref:clostripain-related cysteine peptidase n=1 Tax=Butyrivibrio sp. AE2015 TaxID=1280663 RepID=UPI0003B5E935|nr:clostripain-related cysteine peptidase [Butyrivibrio sp. AE2015]